LNWRTVSKEAARAGVVASIVYLAASLALLVAGYPHEHARAMTYGVLLLFPHAVAVAYVASASSARTYPLVGLMALSVAPAAVAPAVAVRSIGLAALLFAFVSAVSAPAAALVGAGRRRSVRLSLFMVSLSYAATLAVIAYMLVAGHPRLFSQAALALVIAYPVLLIYAVTVHALPATFSDEPSYPAALLLLALGGAGALLVASGSLEVGAIAALSSAALYVYAARLYKVGDYRRWVESRYSDKGSPAYKGMRYFLDGHLFVIVSIVILAVHTVLYIMGACNLLCLVHSYAMGFVTVHVLIHAPMMLPVILRIRHRRRYTLAPLATALAATLLWPLAGPAALAVYVFALLLAARIVV